MNRTNRAYVLRDQTGGGQYLNDRNEPTTSLGNAMFFQNKVQAMMWLFTAVENGALTAVRAAVYEPVAVLADIK